MEAVCFYETLVNIYKTIHIMFWKTVLLISSYLAGTFSIVYDYKGVNIILSTTSHWFWKQNYPNKNGYGK
jgi:hypothetical protein